MNKESNYYGGENHNQNQNRVTPLPELMESIRRQIEFECFKDPEIDFAEEIVRIIAEVYRLRPETEITIAGEKLPVDLVRETFLLLTHDNVEQVMSDFLKVNYQIRSVKTYLRTALYNSAYEMTSRIKNDIKTNLG